MAEQEVDDLVSQILNHVDSGAFVNKYIVIIEGIDNDGARCVYMSTNDEAKKWDNLGLLRYAQALEEEGIRR